MKWTTSWASGSEDLVLERQVLPGSVLHGDARMPFPSRSQERLLRVDR